MPKFDITKLNVAIDKLLEILRTQGIGFCSRRIAGIAISRLPGATRKSLPPT